MNLDLSSLKKSIAALEQSLSVTEYSKDFHSLSLAQQETLQSGVIQNFEICYELSWKFLQIGAYVNSDGMSSFMLFF